MKYTKKSAPQLSLLPIPVGVSHRLSVWHKPNEAICLRTEKRKNLPTQRTLHLKQFHFCLFTFSLVSAFPGHRNRVKSQVAIALPPHNTAAILLHLPVHKFKSVLWWHVCVSRSASRVHLAPCSVKTLTYKPGYSSTLSLGITILLLSGVWWRTCPECSRRGGRQRRFTTI